MELKIVIALLCLIVVLLSYPERERSRAIAIWMLLVASSAFVYYIIPILLGVLLGVLLMLAKRIGWIALVVCALAVVYGGSLARLLFLDTQDRKALRSGSQVVFDEWVERYVKIFGYSREKAIEVATRVRDGR